MSIMNILRLKILDLLASRGLLLVLLILPPLLGLISGTSNMINNNPEIRLAVVDLDQTPMSLELISGLQDQGWSVSVVSDEDARRQLVKAAVDGVITIRQGYGESLPDLDVVKLSYTAAEGSMITTMIREAIAAEVIPAHSRLMYLQQLEERYASLGQAVPADLAEKFAADAAYFAEHQARLDMTYIGATIYEPAVSYLVSDYSMEIFFLGIYAILGTIALSGSALRRRLLSTSHGFLLDYSLSIVSLFLLGLVQIALYSAAMFALMQTPVRLADIAVLAVCLGALLGLSQLLSLFHDSIRLYISLLVLLMLSVASGCFFQLSQQLVTRVGQYLPQGWALAALRGYPVLPAIVPVACTVLMLAAGYAVQAFRTRRMQ